MRNDNDIWKSESLYLTLDATSLIEKLSELLGLTMCSLDERVKAIGQGLHHKSWIVRLEAVKSLGALGKQAEPVLTRMLHDENECVRLLAQYELQRLALKESSASTSVEYTPQEGSSHTPAHLTEQLSLETVQTRESEKQKHRYALTWRELLEVILEDPYAQEKLTKLLRISHENIIGWIQQKANPDFRIFQQILDALPDDYDALLELIQREFPHFVPERSADSEAAQE